MKIFGIIPLPVDNKRTAVDVFLLRFFIIFAVMRIQLLLGHEDERIFIVNRNLLVPFRLEDSNYEGPCKSPQESLSKALSKI